MRALGWIAAVAAGLALVWLGVGLALPAGYTVERSIVIAAPRERIHALVGDLDEWPAWSPWEEDDPSIVIRPGERRTGTGAGQSWTGDGGSGELVFTRSARETGIVYDLSFDEGRWRSVGALRYEPAGRDSTRVVWTMAGDNAESLIGRYFGLFLDSMVGPMFERGLEKLEQAVESAG